MKKMMQKLPIFLIGIMLIFIGCSAPDDSDRSNSNNPSNPNNPDNPQNPGSSTPVNLSVSNTTEWEAALNTIKNGGSGTASNQKNYIITVSGNVQVNGSTSNSFGTVSYITVTLKGNGKLYIIGKGSLINIGNIQTVIIDSPNLTLEGLKAGQNDSTFNNNRAVIFISIGTLELKNGNITGNKNDDVGGGVNNSGGNFIMSGGNIIENTSSMGGGVYAKGGNFTMSGGTICENSGYFGVSVNTFTMTGGSISNNNTIGVFASSIIMSGGNISNNIGVGVIAGNFTMTGGIINGNTGSNKGGGVLIANNFTMSGGIISGNVGDFGAGVCIDKEGTFIKSGGGIIYGENAADNNKNTASDKGHAVYWDRTPAKYRNTTLGENDNINTNTNAGWEQ